MNNLYAEIIAINKNCDPNLKRDLVKLYKNKSQISAAQGKAWDSLCLTVCSYFELDENDQRIYHGIFSDDLDRRIKAYQEEQGPRFYEVNFNDIANAYASATEAMLNNYANQNKSYWTTANWSVSDEEDDK